MNYINKMIRGTVYVELHSAFSDIVAAIKTKSEARNLRREWCM